MTITGLIAKNFREIHFGGNWTASSLQSTLEDVTWEEAITKIDDFNTIAVLTCHSVYYVNALLDVLENRPLTAKDELSFACPEIGSESDWKVIQTSAWENAEKVARLIERLEDDTLKSDFTDPKYGNYFRNIHGTIEHMHYHLGQIVVLKRIIRKNNGK